jgi:hypothetical protein
MNRRLAWGALGGLAFVLLLILGFELMGGAPDTPAPTSGAAVAAAVDQTLPAPAPRDPPRWAEAILIRPLFDPSRKGEPAAPAGQTAEPLPRLAGVVLADGDKRAIFQPDGDKKAIVVGEGDQLAGWTVRSIAEDAVTIGRANGTRTLRPKLDAKPRPSPSGQGAR